jgi:hypothetical protein
LIGYSNLQDLKNLEGLLAEYFPSPDCSDILFLRGLEKSVGKKDIAESGIKLLIKK